MLRDIQLRQDSAEQEPFARAIRYLIRLAKNEYRRHGHGRTIRQGTSDRTL